MNEEMFNEAISMTTSELNKFLNDIAISQHNKDILEMGFKHSLKMFECNYKLLMAKHYEPTKPQITNCK